MSTFSNQVVKKIFIVSAWAGLTFTSHYFAKIFLDGSNIFGIDVLILTSVQMLLASQLLIVHKEVNFVVSVIYVDVFDIKILIFTNLTKKSQN